MSSHYVVHCKLIQSCMSVIPQYNWEKNNILSLQAPGWLCGLMPAFTFALTEGTPKLSIDKQCKGLTDPRLHFPKWANLVFITRFLLPRCRHFSWPWEDPGAQCQCCISINGSRFASFCVGRAGRWEGMLVEGKDGPKLSLLPAPPALSVGKKDKTQ